MRKDLTSFEKLSGLFVYSGDPVSDLLHRLSRCGHQA